MTDPVNISPDALSPAHTLKNNNLQKRNIRETTTGIMKRINEELIIAHREGKHHIITTIPITFSIANMSNKDSQRVVWAAIIDELINKKYRVWINPSKNECRIKITWMSPEDESVVKYQTALIAQYTQSF